MGAPQEFRQRYIAFKVENDIQRAEMEGKVKDWGEMTDHFYDPWLVIFDEKTGEGLIKCEQGQLEGLERGIMDDGGLEIRILGLSGTIKKARKKFLEKS